MRNILQAHNRDSGENYTGGVRTGLKSNCMKREKNFKMPISHPNPIKNEWHRTSQMQTHYCFKS